jgi:hypothetical protein
VKRTIDRLRQKVREQQYTISAHANKEMSDDELTTLDVEQAVLTGNIKKRFTKDPRGTRYEIVGQALDGRPVAVVCRMLGTGWLRIITVYALESEEL